MPHTGDVLDLSPIGAIFSVRKTAEETQGRSFEMEWELFLRSGGTPVHVHPHATESYEVLAGELELYVTVFGSASSRVRSSRCIRESLTRFATLRMRRCACCICRC